MNEGYIKLYRKFFSDWWKEARTFSECEAWIDLIQAARFEATVQIERIGGREVSYGRGQYPASISFLAKKWKWSDKKVRRFLEKLKKNRMITVDSSQGMSIITLCNYETYNGGKGQGKGQGKDIPQDHSYLQESGASTGAGQGQGRGKNNKKEEERLKKEEKIYLDPPFGGVLPAFPSQKSLFRNYIEKFNAVRKSKYTTRVKRVETQFYARIKQGFTVENMIDALEAAMQDKYHIDTAFKYLTPEFFTRSDKIERYLNQPQVSSDDSGDEWEKRLAEKFKNEP
jgi:uncharacterized phage protein (TIGR02220 family)